MQIVLALHKENSKVCTGIWNGFNVWMSINGVLILFKRKPISEWDFFD